MNKEARQLLLIIVGVIIIFLGVWWFGNSAKVPISERGLAYSGGPFDDNRFIANLEPGAKRKLIASHPLDWLQRSYGYPETQRDYIISSKSNEGDEIGVDFIKYPSSDSVMMTFNIALYFDPNWTAPAKGYRGGMIQKFHERIGIKYDAWTDEGWKNMLRAKFRKQIENALQKQAAQYTAEEIYTTGKFEIEKNIGRDIDDRIERVLGDKYFKDFRLRITKAEPPKAVKNAYNKKKAAEVGIEEQKALVEQANQQAKAAEKLDQVGSNYVTIKAIESGNVQFMVIPSEQPIAVTAR